MTPISDVPLVRKDQDRRRLRDLLLKARKHSRVSAGARSSRRSSMTFNNRSSPLLPIPATIPNSARWARRALINVVLWRMNSCRVPCSTRTDCWSGVLIATNRMVSRFTASQMASASAMSFLFRFT